MTIKDIARESGYAVGTVSRVLNNNPRVSEGARRKILAVVAQHGYQPNANAKHLKQHCLLYTSDAADDPLCVEIGGHRIIKKKKKITI